MNIKGLIELLTALPSGSKVSLGRDEFEALFCDLDPQRWAEQIARLNDCALAVDGSNGMATFTRG